jgi:imidazolonepropionase
MDNSAYGIRVNELLTMPDEAERLSSPPGDDIFARDKEITGSIEDAGLLIEDGTLTWFGKWGERPDELNSDIPVFEAGVATPGWIDCHTHSVFAGQRADEFVLRNAGKSYSEFLESGGGILDTVHSVRQARREELADLLETRVYESIRYGVTTLEIKSGYGLTTDDELKMLRAIKDVEDRDVPCELVPCFMGAHAIPSNKSRDEYVDLVCEMLDELERLADSGEQLAEYCDVFCDDGAFTVEESRRILEKATQVGLTGRIHADELSESGGAKLASEIGLASADHLEHTPRDLYTEMAESGVTPVLMPAVNLTLGTLEELPDARAMLEDGCEIALSTDFNPGSAPMQHMELLLSLACTLYKLTPGEALRGVTIGAAGALERDDIGRIREGESVDLTLLDVEGLSEIPYNIGENHVIAVVQNGEFAYWTDELEF